MTRKIPQYHRPDIIRKIPAVRAPNCSCGEPERPHRPIGYRQNKWLTGPVWAEEVERLEMLRRTERPIELNGDGSLDDAILQTVPSVLERICNRYCAVYYIDPSSSRQAVETHRKEMFDRSAAAWFHHGQKTQSGQFLTVLLDISAMNSHESLESGVCKRTTSSKLRRWVESHETLCRIVEKQNRHSVQRSHQKLLPAFRRHFIIADLVGGDLTLVKISSKRHPEEGWTYEKASGFSWRNGPIGEILKTLLQEVQLPPSAHSHFMYHGTLDPFTVPALDVRTTFAAEVTALV